MSQVYRWPRLSRFNDGEGESHANYVEDPKIHDEVGTLLSLLSRVVRSGEMGCIRSTCNLSRLPQHDAFDYGGAPGRLLSLGVGAQPLSTKAKLTTIPLAAAFATITTQPQ